MRAVVTTGQFSMAVDEVEVPVPAADEALVAVEAVGLCGSDFHIFDGSHFACHYPVVQGHEVIGRVVALPEGVASALRVGDRVAVEPYLGCSDCYACRRGRTNCCARLVVQGVHADGGLRELTTARLSHLHPIGDLPTRVAVLTEPMTIAFQALSRAAAVADGGVAAGDDVLILGAGPIGVVTAIACLDHGARVFVVDREPARLARAEALGVTGVADSSQIDVTAWIREQTHGDGPGFVIEATGVAALLRDAIDQVAVSGTVVVLGMSDQEVTVPVTWFSRKEVTVVGSRTSVGQFPAAIELLGRVEQQVSGLVTNLFELDRAAEAIEFAMAHPEQVCKVAVLVSEEVA